MSRGPQRTDGPILTAGVAGLFAGAMSMAAGEYVSVSTQRDTEQAVLEVERRELLEMPDEELAELAGIYSGKGLTKDLAQQVAEQLTAHDALAAHADAELGIDPDNLSNPWEAASASFVSFVVGALLPMLAIGLPPRSWRITVTFVAVIGALALTGLISSRLGQSARWPAIRRNVFGGILAMVVTYAVGRFAGTLGA